MNGASIAKVEDNETSESCGFLPDVNPDVCAPFWGDREPPVILISLDGFRPEVQYLYATILLMLKTKVIRKTLI